MGAWAAEPNQTPVGSQTRLHAELIGFLRQNSQFGLAALQQCVANARAKVMAWMPIPLQQLDPCIPSRAAQRRQKQPWLPGIELPPRSSLLRGNGWLSHYRLRRDASASQGSTGVTKRLETELRQRGINVSILICTENFYDRPITARTTASSQIAQKLAEVRWSYRLNHKSPPLYKLLTNFLKGLLNAFKSLFQQKATTATGRLINIELAHLWLMQQAIEVHATRHHHQCPCITPSTNPENSGLDGADKGVASLYKL
jgi:hypothetical protein